MANRIPGAFYEEMATGTINFASETVRCIAVDSSLLTTAPENLQYVDEVDSAARIATTSVTTPGVSRTGDIVTLTADNPVFATITGEGVTVDHLVYYVEEATEATSPICAVVDEATGLPFAPAGVETTVLLSGGGIISMGSCT